MVDWTWWSHLNCWSEFASWFHNKPNGDTSPNKNYTKFAQTGHQVAPSENWSNRIAFNQVWLSLIQFDPVWSSLIMFDWVSSSLIQFDPLFSSLIHFVPVWSSLIMFYQVWSKLIRFVPVWSGLTEFDQVRSIIIKILWLSLPPCLPPYQNNKLTLRLRQR